MSIVKDYIEEYTTTEKFREYLVNALTLVAAMAVRGIIKYVWKASTDTEPPENPASNKVSWNEAFLFTILTGILVSVAKLLVRRNISIGIEDHPSP